MQPVCREEWRRAGRGEGCGSDGWPTGVSGALHSIVSEERRHGATRERSGAWAEGVEGGEAARGAGYREARGVAGGLREGWEPSE